MIVAVLGVGTGVGKTVATAAWLRRLRRLGRRVHGWKAVESGGDDDEKALAEACGVRIPAVHRFPDPVSPHLGARKAGIRISATRIAERAVALSAGLDGLFLELAGGAFSPLDDDGTTNVDVIAGWVHRIVLVASDRLGVLHDVEACRRAGVRFDALLLTRGAPADLSRSTNAEELARRNHVPVIAGDFAEEPPALAELDAWFA